MRSITTRLVILGFVLSSLVFISSFFFVYKIHQRQMEMELEKRGGAIGRLIGEMVKTRMKAHDQDALKGDVLLMQETGLVRGIVITDSRGRVRFSSGTQEGRVVRVEFVREPECLTCHRGEGPVGYATLYIDDSSIKGLQKGFFRSVLLGQAGLVMIFLVFGGLYINHWIVRRLKRLRDRMEGFTAETWTPLSRMGMDEIGDIARHFNRMAQEVLQRQRELEESKNYLRNLFDSIGEMIVVIDRDFRVKFANRRVLEYVGLPESEVLGQSCHRLFHGIDKPCFEVEGHPDAASCGLREALEGKRGTKLHLHFTEKGRRVFSVTYQPFYLGSEIPYVVEVAEDVTDRYIEEEERRVLASFAEALQGVSERGHLWGLLVKLGTEQMGADSCNLFIYDRDSGRLYLLVGTAQGTPLEEHLREVSLEECVSGFAVRSGSPFIAESLDEFPDSRLRPVIEEAGIQCILCVPLKIKGRVFGLYNLGYPQRAYYRKTDISFLELLEKTINRAVERVEQFGEVLKQREQLRLLAEVAEAVSRSNELAETLPKITEAIQRILRPDISVIFLYERKSNALRTISARGIDPFLYRDLRIPLEGLQIKYSPEENVFSCLDIERDERWAPIRQIAAMLGVRSFYARCLFSEEGEKLGAIAGLWRRPNLPSLQEIELFNAFSRFAEISIRKALLLEEVQRRAEHWSETFDSFSDPLFITDSDFNLLMANRAFKEYTGQEDVVGKKCYTLVHGSDSPDRQCPHLRALREGKTSSVELEEGGRVFYYTCSPIKTEEGVRHVIHSMKDITPLRESERERQRLRDELLQAQKMEAIGRLTGGIAHDFNNILTGIMGHTELALMKTRDDSIKPNLRTVLSASERAKEMVSQLLLFGRKSPTEMRVYPVRELIEECTKLIRRLIGEDVELVVKIQEGDHYLKVDRSQFTQVLLNLAVNARDAMPEGGRLSIEVSETEAEDQKGRKGRYILIRVSDTGVGIPERVLPKIFEPYFTTKPEGKGTGLGLSVVYSVVDSHGGFIRVSSTLGRGTTFNIFLPEAKKEDLLKTEEKSERLPRGTESILLVDDEELIRETGRVILEDLGYRVTTASSGKEALQLFRTRPHGFDLIISDLVMPGMNGEKFFEEVRKIRKDIPFAVITGYRKHLLQDETRYRFRAIIEKPFNVKEIAYKVRYLLDGEI